MPEDTKLSLAPLDGELVAEPAGGISVHLPCTQELNEPLAQGPTDVVTELVQVLVLPLASRRAGRQVALGDDLSLLQPLQDDQLGIIPVGMPLAVV